MRGAVSPEVLLRVENLAKHFPVTSGVFGREIAQVKAVDGVSFELRAQRTLGLVGESGCGKTTVGECIVRLLEPTAGRILFDGRDITHEPLSSLRGMRSELQIIFQDPSGSLNPRMTVADIVGEAIEVHGLARGREVEQRVFDVLEKVGIPPAWINRYPHEFSGGQRQRISIARAIALEPKLVVCDESVSALDVSIQAQVINLLIDLQREMEIAYLFISHDLAVVKHIADDVAVMYLGQIVESAPTAELFARPGHPYARSLLSAIPVADPTHRSERMVLEGDVPSPINPPPGCRFHTRCPAVVERCRSEEPPAFDVGDAALGHRIQCWHAEGVAADPDWFRLVSERTEEGMREIRRGSAPAALASRFALAARRRREQGEASAVAGEEPGPARPAAQRPRRATPTLGGDAPNWRARSGAAATGLGLGVVVAGAPWLGGGVAALAFFVAVRPRAGDGQRARWTAAFAMALLLCAVAGAGLSAAGRVRAAQDQLDAFEVEIAALAAERGALPGQLGELGWRLAAIAPQRRPLDPWGGMWVYRVPGGDGRAYDLGSYGPDAKLGGGDDIGRPFDRSRPPASGQASE